ncbi:GNAT family N-acetyltransferase [Paenibacillus solani]|uniref:GNAT family N-acetyltransferase n=1 Tax=Paenibacillus solani TaxID=1705565 RepID=UPI003D2AE2E8
MQTFPTLRTERLVLRQLQTQDSEHIFSYFSTDEVTKYYDLDTFTDPAQAESLIISWQERYNNQQGIRWAISFQEEDRIIGTCGFHNWSKKHRKAEVGYELSLEYWGHGMMTEALNKIISYGTEEMGLNRIGAVIFPDNAASRRLLEKTGFCEEGILKGYYYKNNRFIDALMFSKLHQTNLPD